MKRRIALWLALALMLSMIPAAAFAELGNCKACGGRGIVICWRCEGVGTIDCPYCDETCENCDGGRIDCPACNRQCGFACTACGGSGHIHTFSTDWSHDEHTHWHAASCGHDVITDEGGHYDNDADGVCDVCGANLGEAPEPEVDPHKKDKCGKRDAYWKSIFRKAGLIWKNVIEKKTDFGRKNISKKKADSDWKNIAKKNEIRIRKETPKKSDVNSKKNDEKSPKNIIHIYSKTPKKSDVNSKKSEIHVHDVNSKKSDMNSKKSEIRVHDVNSKKSDVSSKKSEIRVRDVKPKKNDVNSKKNKSAFSKRR